MERVGGKVAVVDMDDTTGQKTSSEIQALGTAADFRHPDVGRSGEIEVNESKYINGVELSIDGGFTTV